jgi:TRAP-type uncharacterized transport system substrate-binding protein
MSTRTRLRRVVWVWLAPLAGVAALGLAVYLFFHTPGERTYRLTMTAGNLLNTRSELAEVLRDEAAPRGVTLEIHGSIGSEEALDWVNTRKVDLALVQGGLSSAGRPNVRQVAALQVEPLHLLVKQELYEEVSARLTALGGKTINTGEVGSGTHALAVKVLEFAGLRPRADDPKGGYIPMPMSREEMFAVEDVARLPAAVFIVSSLPSRAVRLLVTRHGYRLVPLRFGEAFALEALESEGRHAQPANAEDIDYGRTFATTIPAFTYSVEPPVPAEPLPSLGNRLLLVAHKDVPPQAALQLIEAIYSSQFARVVRPPLDDRLMEMPPEFAWHAGTLQYQQRNMPLLPGAVMDSAHKALLVIGAALSGLVVVWRWFKLRAESRRGAEFKPYFRQVTRVEERALEVERGSPQDLRALLALQGELTRLKSQALDQFTEGELEGGELMTAFLAQVADTRDYLTRLIAFGRQAAPDKCQGEAEATGHPPAGASGDSCSRPAVARAPR